MTGLLFDHSQIDDAALGQMLNEIETDFKATVGWLEKRVDLA